MEPVDVRWRLMVKQLGCRHQHMRVLEPSPPPVYQVKSREPIDDQAEHRARCAAQQRRRQREAAERTST